MSKKYNLDYLEKKFGPFDNEFLYPRASLIEGPIIYVEKNTKQELENELKTIKDNDLINPTYIWGYVLETDAIYVTRIFGENKVFIYNPDIMKKLEYKKGKIELLEKLQKDTINDLFDQKAVFDHFYRKLWDLRLELGEEIRDKNGIPDNLALMEAQHIIDRIIFTYFICEKKLISVENYGPITGKELFSDIIGELTDKWGYLKKLFFEQFAKENIEDLECEGDVYIAAPYLNGGLFRPKMVCGVSEENLIIEYDWNRIFEPLNKYTWMIEDEIPYFEEDNEGNLTPEILGHIYEKFVISMEELNEIKMEELNISSSGDLRRGNKKIGAYYTPEHITDYICRNTLNRNIYDKIGIIEERIDFKSFLDSLNNEQLLNVIRVLDEIKICDPACGSGAFLIKTGEIILEYKIQINKLLNCSNEKYSLKKDIIINNLHGVDIQEGAVEICKLRLWLWLISSAKNKNVEPLPNIEYNFSIGNSLIGWVNEKLDQNLLVLMDEKIFWVLDALKAGYKNDQLKNIDLTIEKLKKTNMESYAKAYSLLKNLYSYSAGHQAEVLKETIERIRTVIYHEVNRIFYTSKEAVKEIGDENGIQPFHWRVDFNEIMVDGGFDIVLGNPPYLGDKGHKDTFRPIIREKFGKKFYKGQMDIFYFFYHRALDIVKEEGIVSFITTNYFITADGALKLRKDLNNRTVVLESINFNELKIFEDAKGQHNLILILKKIIDDNIQIRSLITKRTGLATKDVLKTILSGVDPSTELYQFPQNELYEGNEYYIRLNGSSDHNSGDLNIEQSILKKIKMNKDSLGSICYINAGIGVTVSKITNKYLKNYDMLKIKKGQGVFVVSKKESVNLEQDLIKDFVKNSNIFHYSYEKNEDKLIYLTWNDDIDKFPNTKNHLQQFKKILEDQASSYEETFPWFALNRPRTKDIFENTNKIILPYRSKKNNFAYSEEPIYGSRDVIFIRIKNEDFFIKYILALLNSKLYYFWLYHKGKRKGETLELYPKPLSMIPIKRISLLQQEIFVEKSDKMIKFYNRFIEELNSFKRGLEDHGVKKYSKKIDKFYNLSLKEFMDEIKKKNKKINDNSHNIEKFFLKSVDEMNHLKNLIQNCEQTIDEMVYQLYGLNEDEIQIVEEIY